MVVVIESLRAGLLGTGRSRRVVQPFLAVCGPSAHLANPAKPKAAWEGTLGFLSAEVHLLPLMSRGPKAPFVRVLDVSHIEVLSSRPR
jgi:hypothetical protein